MMREVLDRLTQLGLRRGQRALVAVSGGMDSVVLLDLLCRHRAELGVELRAGHVDHGIHPESSAVAASVELLAESYGVRALTAHLALGPAATETGAREARHHWLEETREREGCDWIITAHHADDQVETVLLRVLQGSGPAGLTGMRGVRGRVLHPLLGVRREDLERYARMHGLKWWQDPANHDPRHLRSWTRTILLPLIRTRLPGVDNEVLRAAAQAEDDRAAWDALLDVLPGLEPRPESSGGSVAVTPFAGYDSILGTAVLRAWARRVGILLSRDHAERVFHLLQRPVSGSVLEVGNGWQLEVVFERAHLRRILKPEAPLIPATPVEVEGDVGDGELGRWRLFWRHEKAPAVQERDALTAWFIPRALQVRPWSAGDKVFPLGGRGRRLVVRCFQDAKVPRHLREAWPIVTEGAGDIVWVPGVCRSNRLVPPAGEEALRVDAQVV